MRSRSFDTIARNKLSAAQLLRWLRSKAANEADEGGLTCC